MTCANNCRGVDPNSVIIGGTAVLAVANVGRKKYCTVQIKLPGFPFFPMSLYHQFLSGLPDAHILRWTCFINTGDPWCRSCRDSWWCRRCQPDDGSLPCNQTLPGSFSIHSLHFTLTWFSLYFTLPVYILPLAGFHCMLPLPGEKEVLQANWWRRGQASMPQALLTFVHVLRS